MKKTKKNKEIIIELEDGELSLIVEALKKQVKKVWEDKFYRAYHPECFYDIYIKRYGRLIEKLDVRVPKAVFIKMPKF